MRKLDVPVDVQRKTAARRGKSETDLQPAFPTQMVLGIRNEQEPMCCYGHIKQE